MCFRQVKAVYLHVAHIYIHVLATKERNFHLYFLIWSFVRSLHVESLAVCLFIVVLEEHGVGYAV